MAKSATKKSETKITRITASDSTAARAKKPATAASALRNEKQQKRAKVNLGPLARIGRYFKGSWYELQQVRWPDRRATWGMTGALIAFTGFFVLIILLLDAAFAYVFKLIIGS